MPEHVSLSQLCGFSERQITADLSVNKYKYTLYGGAVGGGKSYFIRWKMVKMLIHWYNVYDLKNIEVGIFCEDYPTLKDRQLGKILKEFPEWLGTLHDDHKAHGKCYILEPEYGSGIIKFRNLDDPSKYQSAEFAAIAVDELTKNVKSTFLDLKHRLRWPGLEETRFFAGTNPGGVGHCVPFGDVLTPSGWKPIQEVRKGEKVLTLLEDGTQGYVSVDQTIQEYFDGELIESMTNGARFVCTPNHKIAIVTETKSKEGRIFHKPSLREVDKLKGITRLPKIGKPMKNDDMETFEVPLVETRKSRIQQTTKINSDDYFELMGWYLSEGCYVHTKKAKRFEIAQTKIQNRKFIEDLLIRAKFVFTKDATGFYIHSPHWAKYFEQFGKCRDKFVPRDIINGSTRQLKLFVKAMLLGDGHGNHYYTTSKQLADDMQEIFHKLGYLTYVSARQRANREGLSYDVAFSKNRMKWVDKKNMRSIRYSGEVYCLGIDKLHRFYLRQNGTVYLSGNSWVKKLWMDRDFEPEEREESDEYNYVPARAEDNPFLALSYLKQLDSLPDEMRKALRDGDWDLFKGQFFSEWRRRVHTCKPFNIPAEWRRFVCGDYGYTAPSAVYWCAVSPDNVLYVYRELYKTGLTYEQLAKEIISMTPDDEQIDFWVFDPAIWAKSGASAQALSGADIIEQTYVRIMKDSGKRKYLRLLKGDNQRVIGWGMVRERLKPKLCADGEVRAGLQVFDDRCTNLVRTMPGLIFAKNNVEDLESDSEDHGPDALRYGIMANPQRARTREEEDDRAFKKKMKENRKKASMMLHGYRG